ncbi:MAG: HPr-rel-A system PqqD family peptide chaperone [Gammaproteobacteria bacterium]|nr:HPr-rel-A system PqqD family peptide chaperone [Gammaproteobacteria bacterium]
MSHIARWSIDADLVHKAVGDDGFVVFDRSSGLTHFLSDMPVLVLELLAETDRSTSELLAAIVQTTGLGPDEVREDVVARTLTDLEKAELITSVAQHSD